MSNVRFVDSAGIGTLISCLKATTTNNGSMALCNVAGPIRVLFESLRLHRLFKILDSREEAITAFGEG